MKKRIFAFLALLMTVTFSGCGNNNTSKPQNPSGKSVSSVIQQQMNQSDVEEQKGNLNLIQSDNNFLQEVTSTISNADVDLTKLSSTMVYSEVYNMITVPENYIGKTIKMNGQFALYQATDANGQPVPNQIYFACVIADATACCQQGLEFILAGDYKYPDDYPKLGAEITVLGEFQTYFEGKYRYCHLVDAHFE